MKITIEADFDNILDPQEMIITDEGLNNFNYVSIVIKKKLSEDEYHYEEFIVPVLEAYTAFQAFNNIRKDNKKYEL